VAATSDYDRLTDRQVTLVLQHLGAEIAPDDAGTVGMADATEKAEIVRAFLAEAADQGFAALEASRHDANLGRAAIEFALSAPETKETAEDLVMDPPDDDQMGVAEVSQYLAALGFVVAFLQTRFEFKISREHGQTKIDMSIGKEALKDPLIEKIIGIAGNLLPGVGGNDKGQ
jgi:hypothetical protein